MHLAPSNKPFTQTNLEKLGEFLEKYGLPNLLEIHGFLAAIISGPNMIMPSEWMGFLGLNTGEYESMDEAQEIFGCIMTIYNDIAHQFQDQTFQVINLAIADQNDSDISTAKNIWAKGYMLGVAYDKEAWLINDEISTLLLPISSLRMNDEDLQQLIHQNSAELKPQQIREYGEGKLSEAANAVYQYWLKRRNPAANINHMQARDYKIGRNEFCPCGSGKKFKKCCLD